MPQIEPLKWEPIPYDQSQDAIYFTDKLFRVKVPGGWLVKCIEAKSSYKAISIPGYQLDRVTGWENTASIAFVPDPQHAWLSIPVVDSAHEAV